MEIELYAILDVNYDDYRKIMYNPRVPYFKKGDDIYYKSIIDYAPINFAITEIIDGKLETKKYCRVKRCDTTYPIEHLDNYKKIFKYNDGIEFDIGKSIDKNKFDQYYQNLKINRHIVKFIINYGENKQPIDFNTHKVEFITMEMINKKTQEFGNTQRFKIVDIKDYTKYDCFKYYTLTL